MLIIRGIGKNETNNKTTQSNGLLCTAWLSRSFQCNVNHKGRTVLADWSIGIVDACNNQKNGEGLKNAKYT